jgi:hypothetical protein
MARRPIIEEPNKSMPRAPSGLSRPDERDVRDYRPPTGAKTPYDPKGVGLHGDNFDYCGTQERDSVRGQSSGSPGLGGDSVRPAGSQGRR